MSITQSMLAEFEHEATTTRKFLVNIPPDKLDWKCHEKSHTIGELAMHIAMVPGGIVSLAINDTTQLPDFSKGWPTATSIQELTDKLDWSIETVRRELPKFDDAALARTWNGMMGDTVGMTMPRGMLLRAVMLNHWYQHRGQLGVYLRLVGAKVPSSYGPSGDEG